MFKNWRQFYGKYKTYIQVDLFLYLFLIVFIILLFVFFS